MDSFFGPDSGKRLKVIWLGHSSLLLQLNGKVILIDPVLSEAASPMSFFIRRFQPAPLTPEQLPKIDYVVISHDHYDHLDHKFTVFMKDKEARYLVPLGVGAHLREWGIAPERITELDWWQKVRMDEIDFIATPAQHSSGRTSRVNVSLWSSWVIDGGSQKIFYSGDSGYDTHFKEIGEKLGPFDIAFIENGQYNLKWREMHLLPEESVQAFEDVRGRVYFPIHWGMFKLAWHPWYEPIVESRRMAQEKGIRFVTPVLGQLIEIDDERIYESWWEALIERKVAE